MDRMKRLAQLKRKSIAIEEARERIALSLPPANFIRQELEDRGWTQATLAKIMEKSEAFIHNLLANKTRISADIAEMLSKALGQDPQFWIGLEMAYRKDLEANKPHLMEIEVRSKLYNHLPIGQMAKYGIIDATQDAYKLEGSIKKLLGLESIDEMQIELKMQGAFRTSARDQNQYALLAWLNSTKLRAKSFKLPMGVFNKNRLISEALKFRSYTNQPQTGPIKAIKTLWGNGVLFIYQPHLEGTTVEGAAFWANRKKPVIVLSFCYKRLDNFWFTLLHELGHIITEGYFSDCDISTHGMKAEEDPRENEANKFAADILIPPDEWNGFKIWCKTRNPSYPKARDFASSIGVHPAIVGGRLRKEGIVPWTHFNKDEFKATINADAVISKIKSIQLQSESGS